METSNLEQEIRDLIADIIEVPADKISPDANLVDDLGMDSMMALEILAALEKKFKIKISEDELRKITTLSNAVELTRSHVKQ